MKKPVIAGVIVVAVALGIAAVVAGPDPERVRSDSDRPSIVASFYPLYEFAQNVGGEKVDVISLVPEGVEPHDWEPTVREAQLLQAADLIVINGAGFEEWVDGIDDGYGIIVDTSAGIELLGVSEEARSNEEDAHGDEEDEHGNEEETHAGEEDAHSDEEDARDNEEDEHGNEEDAHADEEEIRDGEDEHGHSGADPHIWLSPPKAMVQVQNIADSLSLFDPENGPYYQANAAEYVERLAELDGSIRDGLDRCSRDFISFHKAFSYFADEYGLVEHTIIQSTDSHGEVTAGSLEKTILLARDLGIDIVFADSGEDTREVDVIAEEIGAEVLVLSPLEISSGGTYISAMSENLANLRTALC